MPIDASQVQWDTPAPSAAPSIDPSSVKWDSGASADIGSLAQAAFKDAASKATPAQLNDPSFGIGLARSIGQKMGVNPEDVLPQPAASPSYQESGAPAAAASFMQGFAKPLAKAAAVPVGLAGGVASSLGNDSLFKTYDQMTAGAGGDQDVAKSPVAGGAGELLGNLAGFGITPGVSGASDLALVAKLEQGGKAAQKLAPLVAHAIENAPGALAAGGLPTGSEAAQKTLQQGGTLGQAVGEALAGTGTGSAQFLAPVSLEGNIGVRALSGAAIQQGMSQAQQQSQHAIAPEVFQPAQAPDLSNPMTYLGAVLGAAGGRAPVEAYADPMLQNLKDAAGAPPIRPSGPLELPAPEPVAPVAPASATPAGVPPDLANAAGAFVADPKAALSSLDPVVLHQVATKAGFDVRPGTAPSAIIDSIMGEGTPFLHSDVLPEYMAAVQEHGLPAAASAVPVGAIPTPAPAPVGPTDFAQALQAGNAPVPVDSSGTAYTPQQGATTLGQAIGNQPPSAPALPAPVTTVDSQGNAANSATFNAKTKAAQKEAESLQNAVLHRQSLGITPDIERTQAPRWQAQEAASNEIANRLSGEPDELATQREDDSPPWWLAGQHAADEDALNQQAAPNAQKLQAAINTGPANAPMHPWTPVVTDKSIPYAGGQSKDLSTAFIDPRIPQHMQIAGKNVDVHEPITLHENIESSLIRNTKKWSPAELDALAKKVGLQSGKDFPALVQQKLKDGQALSYVQGHNIATKGENHFVAMKYGIPAAKYQMALQPAIKAALKQGTGASDIPAALDTKPYDNMGESHLVPQHDLEPLRKEIGWDQVGGRLLRHADEGGQGGHAPVAGRTTWVGKAGPNGESNFWRMRPAEGGKVTEAQAHAALTKQAAGESLTTREQRFIDYAQKTAEQYDKAYQDDLQQYQQDQHDMQAAAAQEFAQEASAASLPPEDHDEALTLDQLLDRAYDAGADPKDILDATFDGTVAEKARALWDLTRQLGERHADAEGGEPHDQTAPGQADEGLSRTRAANDQANGEVAPAEQDRGVPAEAHQVAPSSTDDFGTPASWVIRNKETGETVMETYSRKAVDALNTKKYEAVPISQHLREVNDKTSRTGRLVRGEQVAKDDAGIEVSHHSLDDNTPEASIGRRVLEHRDEDEHLMEQMRQESRDQGEREASQLGLRDAVSKALGGLGGNLKVEFVHDATGLPKELKLRTLPKGSRRVGTFMPKSNRVFIFTGSNPTPANAAFTAAHEVYGHRAMAMLAEAHPDVKVGNLTAPDALSKALDMAMQNPTVAKVAESMSKQRGSTDRRLMAEEAMADLSAAAQTGNWDKIKTKHGVDVPEGVRNGVKGAIANFIDRMKRILNAIMAKITGKPADFTDAQVHEFMQDSANALHGDEAPDTGGETARDEVDPEAPVISPSMVKQALRERGMSEEAVNAMSRAELRAEAANLRTRSEPTPEVKATGVKNATKEEERAMKGKAEVEHDLSTSNPAQYATAKARFDADPHAGQILAAKVISDKKAITPEDSILLGLDAMRIINARQVAYEQAEKAMSSGDEATRVAALSLVRQLDGQMEANDMAARYSGVRAGQALQARKVMIAQDYSMARMVLRGKVAKGADLTSAERTKIEQAANDIAKRTKELDAREAKLRAMEAEAKPVSVKRAAKVKFDDLAAQLKAIAQKDQMKPGCVV